MSGSARVIVALDKFKGSLTSIAAGEHLAAGLRAELPGAAVTVLPIADGGDGTLAAALATGWAEVPVQARDALGRTSHTAFARRDGRAVLELAAVCGLAALGTERDPIGASSHGLGQVIVAALDAGCRELIIGIGGSASTDGGAGMLTALGACLEPPVTGAPVAVTALDLTGLDPRLAGTAITLASDVDSPLLGPRGAARVFAPQKGASADQVDVLEACLHAWAGLVATAVGRDHAADPGAGAAGGVGFAALAALGARRRPGIDVVLDLIGFDAAVAGADVVITGEGRLDAQTVAGKAPAGVAARAGVPVLAAVGDCIIGPGESRALGFASVYSLADLEPDLARRIATAPTLLERLGARIGRDLRGAGR
jgi:glycerate kinase